MVQEQQIARAVWEGQIDGWTTRRVADHFGIPTTNALRILKKICRGQCALFPFTYRVDYEGVEVADGRVFVWCENADYSEGRGTRHHNWFYT